MPNLMISYSRKDEAFVRRVHEQLAAQGRDIWVDFEDIPKTADWWNEIKAGIDTSDNFVFVISPDSVASEVCGWEVQHAVEHQKRIIPMLRRDVTDPEHKKRMHAALNAHNWIFAREGDDFEKAFSELVKALDTDLEYVRAHTRLLIRAKEWDTANRDASLLMVGSDLQQAEALITGSKGKDPAIAPLQEQYVQESRRVVRTRSRVIAAAVTFVIIVTLLTVVAIWQGLEADRQRGIAVANADAAATSAQDANNNAVTATVAQGQALFAAGTSDANAFIAATSARDALDSASTATIAQGQALFAAGTSAANAVLAANSAATATNAQGQSQTLLVSSRAQVAFANNDYDLALVLALDSAIRLPSVETERSLAAIAYQPGTRVITPAISGWLVSLAVRSDGRLAYVGGCLGDGIQPCQTAYLNTVDLSTGNMGSPWQALNFTAPVADLALSPDDRTLVTASGRQVQFWDAAAGTLLRALDAAPNGSALKVAISPNGRLVAAADDRGDIRAWDLASGNVRWRGTVQQRVTGMVFSPASDVLLVAGDGGIIYRWNAANGDLIESINTALPTLTGIALNQDGTLRLLGLGDGRVLLNDTVAGTSITFQGHYDAVNVAAMDGGSRRVVTGGNDSTLRLWNVATGQALNVLSGHNSAVRDVAWLPDGGRVASVSNDGTLRVWDVFPGAQDGFIDAGAIIWDAVFAPDGQFAALQVGDFDVHYINLETGDLIRRFGSRSHYPYTIVLSPDMRRLVTVGSALDQRIGDAYLWDLDTGRQVAHYTGGHTGIVYAAVFHPDGLLMTAGEDGNVVVWDAVSGARQFILEAHRGRVTTLQLNASGDRLWSADASGVIIEWDVSGGISAPTFGSSLRSVTLTGAGIASLLLTQDERHLMLGLLNGDIILLDVDDPANSRYFIGHQAAVTNLALSADETLLVSGSDDGTVRVWNVLNAQEIRTFDGHLDSITGAQLSADGRFVYSASKDGSFRRWRLDDGAALIDWTLNNRYLRPLTCDELELYRIPPLCTVLTATAAP